MADRRYNYYKIFPCAPLTGDAPDSGMGYGRLAAEAWEAAASDGETHLGRRQTP